MIRLTRALLVSLCLLSVTASAIAQVSKAAPNPAAKKPSTGKPAVSAAAERAARERRATAVSLLVTLADDVRNFADQKLRARTQARIGDALWDADPDQARGLFRKAWDAAELADMESARLVEEDRRRQQTAGRGYAIALPPDLRLEVLRLAAKRDRALGEELLGKLKEAKKQEASDTAASERAEPLSTPAAISQRLRLANQLLDTDVERAMQFADPALGTVTMEGLNFLSFLRAKDPTAADQRYARMLATAGADMQSDANTVSLLSSYLFTPHMFVTFLREGGQNTSQGQRTPPPDVAPELRASYLRIAAQILLRPLPPPEQDRSSSGIQGKLMVIRRLLPIFEQHGPKELVDQLRAEMAALGQGNNRASESEDLDYGVRRGITPDRSPEDREKALLDRLDRARTSAERDGIYLQLANMAVGKGDMKARDFVEKIEEMEMRNKVRAYIDMTLAMQLLEKEEAEKALSVARKGELTPIQKVWVLTQAAKIVAKTEREKALEIIDEAATDARRIDVSDPDRPRALTAVANALLKADPARAWESMPEISKAANSAEGFTGEDGRLIIRLQTPTQTSMRTSTIDDFNLTGIFRAFTQENYTEAVALARGFEREAPRAAAVISIARTILSEKQK